MSKEVPDTSVDFDDCIGKKETENRPGSLAGFFGMSDVPETVEEAEAEYKALDPKNYWKGMPEYVVENLEPRKQLIINFRSEEDMIKFGELVEQKLTPKTKSVWWPPKEKDSNSLKRWLDESEV